MSRAKALAVLLLLITPALAHDHNRPELEDWMKSLHAKGGAWCCDGKDTDPIDDWDTQGGHYRVKYQGQWFDVPKEAIVEGPNKAGNALLWMSKGYGEVSVRCFMPGALT